MKVRKRDKASGSKSESEREWEGGRGRGRGKGREIERLREWGMHQAWWVNDALSLTQLLPWLKARADGASLPLLL